MRPVLRILGGLSALVLGGLIGFGLVRYETGARSLPVSNGPWQTNPAIGSNTANPFTRAGVARTGLLALPHKEAIYYNAFTDDKGRKLRAQAVYKIKGNDLPGRWWSITAYGADDFLISSKTNAYSIKSSQVHRKSDSGFVVYLSQRPKGENWLAAGSDNQKISLTLRIYNPPAGLFQRLGKVDLPTIHRVAEKR